MHKIVIVSRCKYKALKKTKQILDAYALRISDKSWHCNLTHEGLLNLVARLKASARKNSAIAIYYLKNGVMQKYTIIGNKNEFGNDGSCPISTTSKKHISFKYRLKYSNMNYYKIILEFLGYCHDLGKISAGFQDILRNKRVKRDDPFRHEFLSILILASDSKKELIKKIELVKVGKLSFSMLSVNENMLWLFKIILSHHKSPILDGGAIGFKEHIKDAAINIDEILSLYDNKKFQDILKKAYSLRDKVLELDIKLDRVHYIYFRNALMLSDHYISMKHEKSNEKVDKNAILAKSSSFGGEHLCNHLYSVGKMGAFVIENFTYLKKKLMCLDKSELLPVQISARGKFVWQNQGIKALKNVCSNNNCNLVFLGAATGMGKTRMALRVATELCDEDGLRLNVALGLRTLTSQTSKVYKDILEVDNSMIATLIGSSEAIDLENRLKLLDNDDFKKVTREELDDSILLEDGIVDLELPKYVLNKANSIKKKKLISTPIVISTIDYLIKAADWVRSSHLLSQLRVMTSDLIIDEIDMYDKRDFLHILRLVYVTGLFGRNIIITTATILPDMAKLIYAAYFEGVEQFSLYSDGSSNINVSYLSDSLNKSVIVKNEDYDSGINFLENCLIKSSDYYFKEHLLMPKHKIKIIDDFQDSYLDNILELHNKNRIKDKNNNIYYSIGLIRIQKIINCYDIIKKLSCNLDFFMENDCSINVVFYHSRLPIALRSYIESKLDKALYRKGANDPFLASDLYKDGLNKNNKGAKNIITVVVSSPVIEVGRDFDFDWAIVEPTSARAVIQTMGRVNRHRDLKIKNENIFIMNKNYNLMQNKKRGYDNIETQKDIKELFIDIIDNPTSSVILNPKKDSLPYLENESFTSFAEEKFMENFFGSDLKLVSNSLVEFKWRMNNSIKYQYILDLENNCFLTVSNDWDKKSKKIKIVNENIFFNKDIDNDSIFFINSLNINKIINNLRNFEDDDFDTKYMKIGVEKNKNKCTFSNIFGII